MSARSFFGSNILVYTDDAGVPEKQARALDLLERCRSERSGVVSTQVLQEYFVTATKKLKVPAETARRKREHRATYAKIRGASAAGAASSVARTFPSTSM
jgi:predicted nucleic acid-binding protein